MRYERTTHVPNALFDKYLPILTESELRILLVIIRQTNGWKDKITGKRKIRDRIPHSQFMSKAGLSRRVVSTAIQSLIIKKLIDVTDRAGNSICHPNSRKGKLAIYYSCTMRPVHHSTGTSADKLPQPVQEDAHIKINTSKPNTSKLILSNNRISRMTQIGILIKKRLAQLQTKWL